MKVLFVAEAVTLAQVARSAVLARRLAERGHDVSLACATPDALPLRGAPHPVLPITSVTAEAAEAAVTRGEPLYDEATLSRYVNEELALLDHVRPDVVVGDLRWSLAVSGPVARVPVVSMINAYWSPHAVLSRFPVPEHPIVARVGVDMAERFFPLAMPLVFRSFAKPLDALRKRHRLRPFGSLRELITWGDRVVFPDVPELVPLSRTASHERYLGHVAWAPPGEIPRALVEQRDAPWVYVCMGSSGPRDAAEKVVQGLLPLGVRILVATAGRADVRPRPSVVVTDFAPGDRVMPLVALAVTSGGASTSYQALVEGVPVLGIPQNLDQYLAMTAMRDRGVGKLERAGTLTPDRARRAAEALLGDAGYRTRAAAMQAAFAAKQPADELELALRSATGDASW